MALPLKLHKHFAKGVSYVYDYLSAERGKGQAEDFMVLLQIKMEAISKNPLLGSMSDTLKGVRTISITKHNRLFYKVYPDRIAILYLKDTRKRRYKR